MKKDYQSKNKLGYTGGSIVNNPPTTGQDRGSILDLGRAHMPQSNCAYVPQLLSLLPRARGCNYLSPCVLEPMLYNKRSHQCQKPVHHNQSSLHSPQLERSPCVYACLCAQTLQSCLILCDPIDHSSPCSSTHGILQARILEQVAISFSRGIFQPRDRTQVFFVATQVFTAGRFFTV